MNGRIRTIARIQLLHDSAAIFTEQPHEVISRTAWIGASALIGGANGRWFLSRRFKLLVHVYVVVVVMHSDGRISNSDWFVKSFLE